MKIRLENGELLEFKKDFKLSLTLNNPMLTEQGSMSLPIVLPDANRRKLGFPDRIDQAYKIKRVFNASVQAGSYYKPALLRTSSYESGTIGAIYLNESEMYAKMKEVELSQAFDIVRPASDFHIEGSFVEPIDRVIRYMEAVMMDDIKEDFCIFPVFTDQYTETIEATSSDKSKEFTFHQLLNQPMAVALAHEKDIFDTDKRGRKYNKLVARETTIYRSDGKAVDVPKGYGITPFLRENYVLRRIFSYFGYELKESIFDTDPEMQKIVLLNNIADALVKGSLDYSQLVPSGTIKNYLDSVRADYGCEFFVSADHRYVEVKFWNDILENKDYVLLDKKVSGKPIIEHIDSKLIKLQAGRSSEYTSSSFDTIEKFERNYGKIGEIKQLSLRPGSDGVSDGFYHVLNLGDIWEYYLYTNTSGASFQARRYHSKFIFDYYEEKKDIEYEAIQNTREYVAQVSAYIRYTDNLQGGYWTEQGYSDKFLFIGNRRHMNTVMKKTTSSDEDASEIVDEKSDSSECPIMKAFYRGQKETVHGGIRSYIPYGTTHMYDNEGNAFAGGFDLIYGGKNGLYEKFWKKYAAVIRHSFNQINLPLKLDIKDILTFRFDSIYMYKGQPLLPERLEFEINNDNSIKVINAYFRTIRLYLDP